MATQIHKMMNDCGKRSKRRSTETQNTVDTLCMRLMDSMEDAFIFPVYIHFEEEVENFGTIIELSIKSFKGIVVLEIIIIKKINTE